MAGQANQGTGGEQMNAANGQEAGGTTGGMAGGQGSAMEGEGGEVSFTPDPELEREVGEGGSQGGGSGNQFASQIAEHMMVVDAEGRQVGTVDSLDGERIKLTRSGSEDGQHHYLTLDPVESVEGGAVRISGEAAQGLGSGAD